MHYPGEQDADLRAAQLATDAAQANQLMERYGAHLSLAAVAERASMELAELNGRAAGRPMARRKPWAP